jgi:hypothetical protein
MLETETLFGKEINLLRGLSYVFGALSYLKDEPLCSKCNSLAESIEIAKDKFLALEKSLNKRRGIPEEMRKLLLDIYATLPQMSIPDNPVRQKKEGNCKLPAGVCFTKSILSVYEKIEGQV